MSALGGKGMACRGWGYPALVAGLLAHGCGGLRQPSPPGALGEYREVAGLAERPSLSVVGPRLRGAAPTQPFGEWCDDDYRRAARINSDMSQRSNVAMRSGVLLTSRPPCERTNPIAGAATLAHPRSMTL